MFSFDDSPVADDANEAQQEVTITSPNIPMQANIAWIVLLSETRQLFFSHIDLQHRFRNNQSLAEEANFTEC